MVSPCCVLSCEPVIEMTLQFEKNTVSNLGLALQTAA
jgi:hypothetical protein